MRSRCAVVGHPVAHSLSPALHTAAYAALGLGWTFEAVDVAPGGLPAFVSGLDADWRGLAVTMPHKADAAAIGRPDAVARRLGVANTIVLADDGPRSYNTDVTGFIRALEHRRLNDVADVVILGAGATARAALLALSNIGVTGVTTQVRDPGRAADWLRLAGDLGFDATAEPLGTPHETEMVISTLPPQAADEWADGVVAMAQCVFDASYDPWPTGLIQAASQAGLPVVTGLDLLAGQAMQQIDLLAGDTVDIGTLLRAGEAEIRRRMA